MPKLTPVDNDPFAAPATTGPKLTPVDHDPFAPAAASSDIAQPGPDSLGNMSWFDPRAANAPTKDFLLAQAEVFAVAAVHEPELEIEVHVADQCRDVVGDHAKLEFATRQIMLNLFQWIDVYQCQQKAVAGIA